MQRQVPFVICIRLIKVTFLYFSPVISAGFFFYFIRQKRSFPAEAQFYVHILVLGSRRLYFLLYPARQLHHVCRMDAEEDVHLALRKTVHLSLPKTVHFINCISFILELYLVYKSRRIENCLYEF